MDLLIVHPLYYILPCTHEVVNENFSEHLSEVKSEIKHEVKPEVFHEQLQTFANHK